MARKSFLSRSVRRRRAIMESFTKTPTYRTPAGTSRPWLDRLFPDGRAYFVLKATNGQEVGRSQMYKSDSGCKNGMKSVARNAADASVVEE